MKMIAWDVRGRARALECDDLSPLSAGDLSPSNVVGREYYKKRTVPEVRHAAPRGAALPTSRQSRQSCDQSQHSKAPARVTRYQS